MIPTIEALADEGALSLLDRHFAQTLGRIAGEEREEVLLAAALASHAVRGGHVCLELGRFVREPLLLESGEVVAADRWPAMDDWRSLLRASGLVGAGEGAVATPLVLDDADRLYLRRYWEYQEELARGIGARVLASAHEGIDDALLRDGIVRLFGAQSDAGVASESATPLQTDLFADDAVAEPDWQRVAAILALRSRFCVISGGPGTGKTSTVVKILALLVEQALGAGEGVPRISLVAPTGKAAATLSESIRRAKVGLSCSNAVKDAICEEASTIHRCLGFLPGSPARFRHDAANPILADLVLVDEASMVDLSLMTRLLRAVPQAARVVLLGDQNQLASVEAGSVLGDICNPDAAACYSPAVAERVAAVSGDRIPSARGGGETSGLRDSIVQLTKSYRYAESSAIGELARAINAGDVAAVLALLEDEQQPEVSWVEPGAGGEFDAAFRAAVVEGYRGCFTAEEPEARLAALGEFRVLCTHRRGSGGVEVLNATIESLLRAAGLVGDRADAPASRTDGYEQGELLAGRPVMVTRNDYELDLFNGDVGVVATEAGGASGVYFPALDGVGVRRIALARLPDHESVYAMTVHKSQGSEFDSVVLVLPEHPSPVLSRELVYTAVTRARRGVAIYGRREVLQHGLEQRIARASGLRDALWG